MDQIPCPDGYLLDPRSALAEGHHALNDYLVRVEDAGWQTAIKEVNAIHDKRRKLLIWKALLNRVLWLRDEQSQSPCVGSLRGLAERIEKWTLSPTEADLIEILDATAEVATYLAPYPPMPHLFAHLDAHGLTARMAEAIAKFRGRVYDDCLAVSQTSFQMFRSRLDMLAWRDERTPIDRKRCWSEQVRADFREMQGEERENWRRLLYSVRGDEGTRPAPKWLANAEKTIEQLGRERFERRLAEWLAPLKRGTTHRLSREGSYLLRAFVWMAQASQAPALLARVAEIAEVEFKPKANGQKIVGATADTAGAQPAMGDLVRRALAAAVSSASPELAARVEVGPESVSVRGILDSYEIRIGDGAIFRRSDGQRVRITGPVPQHLRLPFPEFGGVMGLMQQVLVLADDESNVSVLTVTSE